MGTGSVKNQENQELTTCVKREKIRKSQKELLHVFNTLDFMAI